MRHLFLAAMLLATMPAFAQRTPGPHDGTYVGERFQECARGGRVSRERLTGEIRNGRVTLPALPGDPALDGEVAADGKFTLPSFGIFRAGTGQVFEGPNDARRLTATHPGRGDCRMGYDMLRQRPAARGR